MGPGECGYCRLSRVWCRKATLNCSATTVVDVLWRGHSGGCVVEGYFGLLWDHFVWMCCGRATLGLAGVLKSQVLKI